MGPQAPLMQNLDLLAAEEKQQSNVGNAPFQTGDNQLKELFEQFGQVDQAKIIVDKVTGRSGDFGFVEMPGREEGLRAIEELDSKDFMGRSLKVNEARARKSLFSRTVALIFGTTDCSTS
jgi:RNA recognition motif-containing protein